MRWSSPSAWASSAWAVATQMALFSVPASCSWAAASVACAAAAVAGAPGGQREGGDRVDEGCQPILAGVLDDRDSELGVGDGVVPRTEPVLGLGQET